MVNSKYGIRYSNFPNPAGQTILEYLFLMGIVIFVFIAMNPMIRRSFQSLIKTTADEIGEQKNGDQNFNSGGVLMESISQSKMERRNIFRERDQVITRWTNETSKTKTNSLTDLGTVTDNP